MNLKPRTLVIFDHRHGGDLPGSILALRRCYPNARIVNVAAAMPPHALGNSPLIRPLVGIDGGASGERRRWDVKNFAAAPERCASVVTSDSGPKHLTRPVVARSGLVPSSLCVPPAQIGASRVQVAKASAAR